MILGLSYDFKISIIMQNSSCEAERRGGMKVDRTASVPAATNKLGHPIALRRALGFACHEILPFSFADTITVSTPRSCFHRAKEAVTVPCQATAALRSQGSIVTTILQLLRMSSIFLYLSGMNREE